MKINLLKFCLTLLFGGLTISALPMFAFCQQTDINTKDETGLTVLMHAAKDGDPKEITDLLAKQADVQVKDQYGWTALMYAVKEADSSKIIALLEGSADVNTADNRGNTPLMIAALEDKPEIISLLLSKDANINATNKKGATALSYAKGAGNKKIVNLLEKGGGIGILLDKTDVLEQISPVDRLPKALNPKAATKARLTEEARQHNVSGSVRMRVLIGTDGKIKNIKVIEGLPYGLTEAASQATSKIKFNPAMNEGKLVEYWLAVAISFNVF